MSLSPKNRALVARLAKHTGHEIRISHDDDVLDQLLDAARAEGGDAPREPGGSYVTHWDDRAKGGKYFSGRLTLVDIGKLRLDGLDRAVVNSPIENAADFFQSMEIIFRRLAELKYASPFLLTAPNTATNAQGAFLIEDNSAS